METKICRVCEKELPLERFRKTQKWHHNRCKKCDSEDYQRWKENNEEKYRDWYERNKENISRKRKQRYQENKEYEMQYKKQWREQNKDYYREWTRQYQKKNKDKIAERMRVWHQENKDRLNKASKEWRENNREHHNYLCWEWQKNNPDKNALKTKRREARKRQLPSDLTSEEWEKCKAYFDSKCAYCGQVTVDYVQEHFIPVVKGGGVTKSNILFSCRQCNLSKGSKDFSDWYPKQPFYSKEREERILNYVNEKEVE